MTESPSLDAEHFSASNMGMWHINAPSCTPASWCSRQLSDVPSDGPSSFCVAADDPLTRNYVASILCIPSTTLATLCARIAFITALLGDAELAANAEDDRELYAQLAARAVEFVQQAATALEHCSPAEAGYVLSTLAVLATMWPVLLDDVERAGIVGAVVVALRRVGGCAGSAAGGLAALRAFAVTDGMRRRVMVDGGIEMALQLMWNHRADRRVQQSAATFIANVAFGCAHRKRRLAQLGAIRGVVAGMIAFPGDENVQSAGALTIRNLTADAQVNQYVAGNEGAMEAVAGALLRFRSSSSSRAREVRLQCVLAVESLCKEDERNRQRLVNIDHLAMTAVMFASDLVKQERKAHRNDADREEEENVNEDGDVVVDEEEVLISDETPNFRHGAALCPGRSPLILSPSLSSSASSDRKTPSVGVRERTLNMGERGGVEKTPPLGEAKANEKKSILRAIVHTMRRDPDDALLLETCLSLLTLVALHRGEVQLRIGSLGGIQVAIAAMRRHSESKSLVAKACSLIRCLCLQDPNRNQVTSGLPVLVSAAREHRRDADVVMEVASALSNAVFEHEKNRAWVINKGGVDAIVQAMNECGGNDVMVLEAGICALRNLVDSSYIGALSAKNEGAVKAAVTALDTTKDAVSKGQRIVQEQAVLFLVDVAQLAPQTTEEMEEIDAADWIENSLAKLSLNQHPELHAAGDKLINVLIESEGRSDATTETVNQARRHPSPTAVSGRFSRRIWSKFLFSRKTNSNGGEQRRRRPIAWRSMPIDNHDAWESERTLKRLSARLRRSAALS